MVRGHPHEVSGAIITQWMVLDVPQYFSMVLAKGDNGTWFSLAHGIGDFSSIKGGKGEWKRYGYGFVCYVRKALAS